MITYSPAPEVREEVEDLLARWIFDITTALHERLESECADALALTPVEYRHRIILVDQGCGAGAHVACVIPMGHPAARGPHSWDWPN